LPKPADLCNDICGKAERSINQYACRRGFDVYVNMVLEDVTEYEITPDGKKVGAGSGRGRHGTLAHAWHPSHAAQACEVKHN